MSWLLPPLPPHFEAALRDVGAQTMEARMAAARRLAQPEPGREQEARQALNGLTHDRDARVRATAVEGLSEVGAADDHTRLGECLNDSDALVRELAVVALSTIEHPDRTRVLIEALDSPHPEVRFQALACCAEQCADEARPHFMRLSRDDDPRVRENAAAMLAGALSGDADDPARVRLQGLLSDADPGVRFRAALGLGEHATEEAIDILLAALEEPDRRLDALEALGVHDRPRVREAAAAIAESFLKPLTAKAAAARALCRLGDRRGVAGLRSVLGAFRSDGRSYAVEIVGELGLSELSPQLERLARRPRGVEPGTLVDALGRLAPESEAARRGLATLASGGGEMGRRARQALASADAAIDT